MQTYSQEKLKRIKVNFVSEPAGKICEGAEEFLPEQTSTKASEWVYSWKFGRVL